jgi:hypothetical protein
MANHRSLVILCQSCTRNCFGQSKICLRTKQAFYVTPVGKQKQKSHIIFAILDPDSKPLFAPHVCAANFQTDNPPFTA